MPATSMTAAEKILAAHAGLDQVHPGQLIEVAVDLVLANDITAPIALRQLEQMGVNQVFDRDRVVLLPDHLAPNCDIKAAEQCRLMREFAREQGITHYYEVGRVGIEHALLPEQGLVLPGQVIVGADSHTCTYGALGAFGTGMGSTDIAVAMGTGHIWMKVPPTYQFIYDGQLRPWVGGKDLILYTIGQIGVDGARYAAMEFAGEAVAGLSMDGRMTMSNMAIEAGAKAGLCPVDGTTQAYVRAANRSNKPYTVHTSDPDCTYDRIYRWDVSGLEPQVAFPHLPSNTRPLSQVGDVLIDQVVIGSCTNGRQEDIALAAGVLAGRKVHPRVRCLIIPATQQIYLDAIRRGWIEIFVEAGAAVSAPTCGPCLGGHTGVLAAGERCVATTNRNFVGRMGHPTSEVYLANPAVAAASAVLGRIGGPDEL